MNRTWLARLPKVELHNHLDGGLRIATVIELARESGYAGLPTSDPDELSKWFFRGGSGSLERYLEGFEHTIAVLQTRPAIKRVAYEAGLDLHADGVVYAEIRFAPVLNTRRGLRREDAIEAALLGFAEARAETGIRINLIVDAMRNLPDSERDARAAAAYADSGVVGFDLAGPEAGYPPGAHRRACEYAAEHGLSITIHAGEADGPNSIAAALDECGAMRIGHGIRITDDIAGATFGPVATRVHRDRIPLEVCPTSNLHTLGISAAAHPLGELFRAGFNVTLNTDNRLMSAVTLTDEFELAVRHHGFTEADLHRVTRNAVAGAFVDGDTRRRLADLVDAAYAS